MKRFFICFFVLVVFFGTFSTPLKGEEIRGFYGEELIRNEEPENFPFEEEQRRDEERQNNEYSYNEEPYMEKNAEYHEFNEEENFFEETEPIRWEWHFDEFEAKVVFFNPSTDEVKELPLPEVVDIYEINGLLAIIVLRPEQERREPQIHIYDIENEYFSEELHMCKYEEELRHIWNEANINPERLVDVIVVPLEVEMQFISGNTYCDWISKISGAKNVTLAGLGGHQFSPSVWEGTINGCKQIRVLYGESTYSSANLFLYDPITKKAANIVSLTKGHGYSKIEKDNVVYLDGGQGGACDLYLYDIAAQTNTKLLSSITVHDISYAGDYIVYHGGKSIVLYQISKKTKQTFKTDTSTVKYGLYLDTDGTSLVYSEGKLNTTTYDMMWDAYVYDIAKKTTKKITKTSFNSSSCAVYRPKIDGNLVVLGKGWGATAYLEIIQVSNLSTTVLKSTTEGYISHAISGNRISYTAYSPSSNDHAVVYDSTDKKEVYRSNSNALSIETTNVYNNHLVYETYAGKDTDIVYTPLVNIPASIKPYMNWLYYMKNDIDKTNKTLVSSYGNDKYMAFTYDQALAVMAFTYVSDYSSAETILTHLQSLIQSNCLTVGYNKYDNKPMHNHRYVGTNAWVVQAINYYTSKTGDKKYQTMAKTLVDWMLTLQASTGPLKGGLSGGYTYDYVAKTYNKDKWCSTEYNLSAYAAITHFADTFYATNTTNWKYYTDKANDIRKFLETQMWINDATSTHRFIRGIKSDGISPDYDPAFDVNTWGILALGKTAKNILPTGVSSDFSIGLKWAYDNCMTKNEKGFSFCSYPTYLNGDIIWTEGTEGMALAMKKAPISIKSGKDSTYFHNQVKAISQTTGTHTGIYYTTNKPTGFNTIDPYYPNYNTSVAGTTWCIFSELGFNPLDY